MSATTVRQPVVVTARNIVELCREGNLCLILDLAQLIDTGRFLPEDADTSYDEVEYWLSASGLIYWHTVCSMVDLTHHSPISMVRLLSLIELLDESQKLRHPKLRLTLAKLEITFDELQAQAHRHHEDHSLDNLNIS